MKNMKKTLCLLLAVLMTVSLLAGCGKKVDDNADSKKVFTVGIDAEYPPFSYLQNLSFLFATSLSISSGT